MNLDLTPAASGNPAEGWYQAELVALSHGRRCRSCTPDGCPRLEDAQAVLAVAPPRPDLSAADPAVLRRAVLVARGLLRRHIVNGHGRCRICAVPSCAPATAATALLTALNDPWLAADPGRPGETTAQSW